MKRLYSFLLFFLIAAGFSCTKDITRFNKDTKHAQEVPGETLFSNAVLNYVNTLATSNVNTNVFRFTVGHWAATTYQDEPQYDFTTRAIPDRLWNAFYRTILGNLAEAKKNVSADATLLEGEKKNKIAQIDIMQVCGYYFLTTTYGDVPYTEAGDDKNLFPKYDDAATVFADLIKRLQADVAALDASQSGISGAQDLIYAGDIAKWKKFGNSLLLRLAMTIAKSDAATSKSVFEAANAGAFSSNDDNAQMKYLPQAINANPLWVDLVQSGRQDMVAGKPLMDELKTLNDPRLPLYFRPNNDGVQVGGVVGGSSTFSLMSKPSEQMIAQTFPQTIMGYWEVEFLRAEAVERNYTVSGSAQSHYNNAITASIEWWGGTSANATTYLAQPSVSYTSAPGDWQHKIGLQKWIALYNEPVQGWVEMRRLGVPGTDIVPLPVGAKSGFPMRLPYSQGEQQLNPDSYKAAATAIGGDKVETKLWFE